MSFFTHHSDVDECLNTPCGQLCRNTEGSFECSCMSGYELQEDGHSCEGNDSIIWFKMNIFLLQTLTSALRQLSLLLAYVKRM